MNEKSSNNFSVNMNSSDLDEPINLFFEKCTSNILPIFCAARQKVI